MEIRLEGTEGLNSLERGDTGHVCMHKANVHMCVCMWVCNIDRRIQGSLFDNPGLYLLKRKVK